MDNFDLYVNNFDQFNMTEVQKLKRIVKKVTKLYVDNFDQFNMNGEETLKGTV